MKVDELLYKEADSCKLALEKLEISLKEKEQLQNKVQTQRIRLKNQEAEIVRLTDTLKSLASQNEKHQVSCII